MIDTQPLWITSLMLPSVLYTIPLHHQIVMINWKAKEGKMKELAAALENEATLHPPSPVPQ